MLQSRFHITTRLRLTQRRRWAWWHGARAIGGECAEMSYGAPSSQSHLQRERDGTGPCSIFDRVYRWPLERTHGKRARLFQPALTRSAEQIVPSARVHFSRERAMGLSARRARGERAGPFLQVG